MVMPKRSVGGAADLRDRCARESAVRSVEQGEAGLLTIREVGEHLIQGRREVGPVLLLQLGAEGLVDRQARRAAQDREFLLVHLELEENWSVRSQEVGDGVAGDEIVDKGLGKEEVVQDAAGLLRDTGRP
jgi:hypothetical protein